MHRVFASRSGENPDYAFGKILYCTNDDISVNFILHSNYANAQKWVNVIMTITGKDGQKNHK